MGKETRKRSRKQLGARCRTVDLSKRFDWPRGRIGSRFWKDLAAGIRGYPAGKQASWGIPFKMAGKTGPRVLLAAKGRKPVTIRLSGKATHLCFLHNWQQMPGTARPDAPREGLVVAEYELRYADGTSHVQPVRGRFEVGMAMAESPGPPWLALPFRMHAPWDPTTAPPPRVLWGRLQYGVDRAVGVPLVYAMPNPHPRKTLSELIIRGLRESPLTVAGLTLYEGSDHPLRHLPRRTYHVKTGGRKREVANAEVDLGMVARIAPSQGKRGKSWLKRPGRPERAEERKTLLQIVGAEDATVSVDVKEDGRKKRYQFSLGKAFHDRKSTCGTGTLEVLDKRRQWMEIRVKDTSTGRPTPVRIHFSGSHGEYIAPYGHHEQVNFNWFEEYGADISLSGKQYAYVPGEFTTDMPVGDVYVDISKGFEYVPVRRKVTIRPGQKKLDLRIGRWSDLRSSGWITADTHVHFISPQTAWLEGQAEGINVVNLLATQLGRLFTNTGDFTGRVGVLADDTIVYVGTENRHHILGHMSLLGTKGRPVYPMCCGGPSEAWLGDPEFMTMAEWCIENKRKGGLVIRPHFPNCGHTEDPVPIVKGLVDAVELGWADRYKGFGTQEWYRYLNCGHRVAVVGGTDKMGAYCALGWLRTYAKLDPNRSFTYERWAQAVRAGRTFSTSGPLIDVAVDGKAVGDTIRMSAGGGTVEVEASATSFLPLGSLEIVCNGRVVAGRKAARGAKRLRIRDRIRIPASGWVAARCYGMQEYQQNGINAAHTSPIYVKCGNTRAFDGPAAQHMLTLVEGGMEYLNTLATSFDESSRKRMVKQFKDVQRDLKLRLTTETKHSHPH